jgi:multisubunit Na+/H+ antiporter MnhC subunit
MANVYAPVMRALVVLALVLATATLMFVAVNTARAARDAQSAAPYSNN